MLLIQHCNPFFLVFFLSYSYGDIRKGKIIAIFNTFMFEFEPGYSPEEGDTLTLFIFAENSGGFDGALIEGGQFECLETREEINETADGEQAFHVIFERDDSCLTVSPQIVSSTINLLI